METHNCKHCNAEWHYTVCPVCGKIQITISDALSEMKEFLDEADWKDPLESIDAGGLLELIKFIQIYALRDTEPENEFQERIKLLETSVQNYASLVFDAETTVIPTTGDDETEEEAREYFIENDVREALDDLKERLENTIAYLDTCVENEVFSMFEPTTKTADDDT